MLFEQTLSFPARGLHRVQVPREQVASLHAGHAQVRVALDPLLTGNGKPYVLMRYDSGPLSLHHG